MTSVQADHHTRSLPENDRPVSVSASSDKIRIAVEGCGHGTLDAIYASTAKACQERGWTDVDLLIICGDFQACRTQQDLNMTAMPEKYRRMGDFHEYYYGRKTAPYLTVFVGGNHEASNHLFELYYGGWVAPNIYYLGAANILKLGPLRLAAMSGIWKGFDYRKHHFERLPYNDSSMRSIYHVRELDTRKLLAYRHQIDIGISHDWPAGIESCGDIETLKRNRPAWREDIEDGKLGNRAAAYVLDYLRPRNWFSGHMHWRYTAVKTFLKKKDLTNSDLGGWHDFAQKIQEADAAEHVKEVASRQAKAAEMTRTGVRPSIPYTIIETHKVVRVDDRLGRVALKDTTNSESSSSNEIPLSLPVKRSHHSSPDSSEVGNVADTGTRKSNPDAIDLDVSSDDENPQSTLNGSNSGQHMDVLANGNSEKSNNPDAIDLDDSDDDKSDAKIVPLSPAIKSAQESSRAVISNDTTSTEKSANDVSHEARAALAAISSTFAPPAEKSAALPHPDTIHNTETKFLALSKVQRGQNFLQLLEIDPFEEADLLDRPFRLSYDPEWLAILRTFASELSLDSQATPLNSNTPGPPHKGDSYYRERILEEERWVDQQVTQLNRLQIPENFEITATHDTSSGQYPRETTNPQTAAFCDLIGIPNLFDMSEDERDARMATGPLVSDTFAFHGRGGHRGGYRASRGRGRRYH